MEEKKLKVYGMFIPNENESNEDYIKALNSIEECEVISVLEESNTSIVRTSKGNIKCMLCFEASEEEVDGRTFEYCRFEWQCEQKRDMYLEERVGKIKGLINQSIDSINENLEQIKLFNEQIINLVRYIGIKN